MSWSCSPTMINKDSLSARIKNIAENKNVTYGVLYSRFFFDCFLKRLSKSDYSDKFILKGGLYLSSLLDLDNRTTMDIDLLAKRLSFNHENVIEIIKSICGSPVDDGVAFSYIKDSPIRRDDIYGGFGVSLEGRLDNIRQKFDIDIATGDPIYPSEVDYSYKCMINEEILPLKCYPIESVVSEKLQTLFSQGILNGRAKDFYDLFILEKLNLIQFDAGNLSKAFELTCAHRSFEIDKYSCYRILNELKNDEVQMVRWKTFARRTKFANGIEFGDVVDGIKKIVDMLFLEHE